VRKKPEVEDKDEYDYDVEFKRGLMENILKFVNMNENNEFFSKTINNFYKDFTQMQNMNKNIEKNKLLLKWEKIFIDRQKMYKNYLVELQKKERRKRKQQKIQKEIDEKIHQEKLKQYEQEKEFLNELEKIRKKVRQKRRNSVEERKKNMKLSLRGSFLLSPSSFPTTNFLPLFVINSI
jgi:DNA repair exonuclease SbcCD nuclease subunit